MGGSAGDGGVVGAQRHDRCETFALQNQNSTAVRAFNQQNRAQRNQSWPERRNSRHKR
jgi:hypothetical protein